MDKALTVAKREYLALVRTRTFLVTIIVIPLLSMSSLLIPAISAKLADRSIKQVRIFSTSSTLANELSASAAKHTDAYELLFSQPDRLDDQAKLDLSEQLRLGELHAFVVHESGPSEDKFRIYMNEALSVSFTDWFYTSAQQGLQKQRAAAHNVEPIVVERIMAKASFEVLPPFFQTESGDVRHEGAASFRAKALIPLVLVMMMFLTMMFQTTPLVQGIVEEKQRKITEVLLGSVSAVELMLGKLLGNVGLVFTVLAIYGSCLVVAAHHFEVLAHVSVSLLVWFVVFDLLAILFYGSMFLAIGSVCNDLQETQNLLMPVILMATLPMIIAVSAASEPLGPVGIAISYLPPATPFMFMIRLGSADTVAFWEPYLAASLLTITMIVTVVLSARVFRIGVLALGKAPRPKVLLRWVLKGY